MRFGIGQPVTRKEDVRFLTGRGRYVADIDFVRQTHAVLVFSPHAHARIRAIDKTAAERMPGVFAALTGEDWRADGLGTLDPEVMAEDMGGPTGYRTKRPPLAIDRVRYVGERVAVVIGATEAQARDAAELVVVDYDVLPAVVNAEDAIRPDAPLLHDGAANNTSFTMRMGNADAADAGFARAHHITTLSLYNNRLTAVTMEPRGCIAEYDPGTRRWTLYSSTQNVHGVRQILAHQILHVPESRIRVVARDVGGGFGMKGNVYPEEAIVVWAARRIGRPVKWIPSRSEALLGDYQGRDQNVTAELALDGAGKFLALRWTGSHNAGAYIEGAGIVMTVFSLKLASTVYDIPAVAVTSSLVFTNTAPTAPYRGAGRPEAVYIMERLVDQAAREMRIDPAELRKKNLIRPEAYPYETRTGWIYDTGNYAAAMAKCQALADWDGYAPRRAQSEAAGKYRGRSITYYVDNTGVFNERMELRFDPSGEITIVAGTLSHGQGHETSYAQMVADWLGVPEDKIHLSQADTDEVAIGRGTYASRSMMIGGSALRAAADEVIERGKRFAAHFMEADCRRHRLCRRRLHDRRHRPLDADWPNRADVVHPGRPALGARRRPPGSRRLLLRYAELPQWLPYLRGRDRPRNRRSRARPLHRRRRHRHRHQPAIGDGPDPRRRRARRRPSPLRGRRLRPRERPIADREFDGLRHPARRHIAAGHRRFQPRPEHDQPIGRQRRRRRRHSRLDTHRNERNPRRPRPARRHRCANARDP